MLNKFFSRLGWFLLLLLLQALLFNHIHISGYATPLPYVYFLIILPGDTPRRVYVLAGFVFGLCLDLFTGTPGMTAAALCATGLITPLLLRAFSPSDCDDETFRPSLRTMETSGFLKYAFCVTLLHCSLFFCIEAFSPEAWPELLINIFGSTLITLLIIIALESFRSRSMRKQR